MTMKVALAGSSARDEMVLGTLRHAYIIMILCKVRLHNIYISVAG